MPLRGDEQYVEIEGTLKRRTAKAILISTEDGEGWVARSCVHFSTDRAVDDMKDGEEGIFKIMEWVAEKNGFI